MTLNSCIYQGKVRHRRNTPKHHQFDFRTFMLMLDLDELNQVFKGRWLWSTQRIAPFRFRQGDYLKRFENVPDLKTRAVEVLKSQGIAQPVGSIRLLTQLRYFGFSMNPVSFFYCYGQADGRLMAIIAEVNNTPWGEQHCYVIPASNRRDSKSRATSKVSIDQLDKMFHVSPFMTMEQSYRMAFSIPDEKLGVKIENHLDDPDTDGVKKILDVSMLLNRKPISGFALNWMLVKFPLISFQIFLAIYWQALRLYFKRIPFVSHPKNSSSQSESGISTGEIQNQFDSCEGSEAEQDPDSILVS